jgi:alcohol dehydrogenase class IV
MTPETVFTYGAPLLKFGTGASAEFGWDLVQEGVERVLVVTDPALAEYGVPGRVADGLRGYDLLVETYDQVHVEPTDESLAHAVDWARSNGPFDAFVAVGGGSSIDTAKAVNLLCTNPGELMDYVNAPVGGGRSTG